MERLSALIALQNEITEDINRSQVGNVYEVLVERRSPKDPNKWTGLNRQGKTINFPAGRDLGGAVGAGAGRQGASVGIYGRAAARARRARNCADHGGRVIKAPRSKDLRWTQVVRRSFCSAWALIGRRAVDLCVRYWRDRVIVSSAIMTAGKGEHTGSSTSVSIIDALQQAGERGVQSHVAGFPGQDRITILCMGIDDNWTIQAIKSTRRTRARTRSSC